jgi:hypothetical protein
MNVVRQAGGIEALPQFDILDRLLVGGAPTVFLPALYPSGGAMSTYWCRCGVSRDMAA